LPTPETQNPSVQGVAGQQVTFFVLAAFETPKTFCGVEFGLGEYDPDIFTFLDWGACAGEEYVDYLELATPGWPGPHEGTACVTTHTPWNDNTVLLYYFSGIAYAEGLIPIDVDPSHDFVGFANCKGTPELPEPFSVDPERRGALGLFTEGRAVRPVLTTRWACCADETCYLLNEADCLALGGSWLPGLLSCFPNPCQVRACCLEDGACMLRSELECLEAGGLHISGFESCDPNPCPQPEPEILPTPKKAPPGHALLSWGRIKWLYR
jgi:hypothetical protein